VQLDEVGKDTGHVVRGARAIDVAGQLHPIPGRKVLEDALFELPRLALQKPDLGREIHPGSPVDLLQLADLALELEQGFLDFQNHRVTSAGTHSMPRMAETVSFKVARGTTRSRKPCSR